jgi:hypothetical protein
MIEKYIEHFDNFEYDHIGRMVFHDGNDAMLRNLLKAEITSKNASAMEHCGNLIDGLTEGLQMTARKGFKYDEEYLAMRKEKIKNDLLSSGPACSN